MESNFPVAPMYLADLRELASQAFSDPQPLPSEAVPGGTISERIRHSSAGATGPLVMCRVNEFVLDPEAPIRLVGPAEYWPLALPWCLLIHGPLLELARQEITNEERLDAEKRLLEAYAENYPMVPLPPSLLGLIGKARRRAPWEGLTVWLDDAMAQVLATPTMNATVAARRKLRQDALSRGASGAWGEDTVAVAELMADVLTICRAAMADVDRARSEAGAHNDSIALSLSAIDDQQATLFESILELLARPALFPEDLTEVSAREAILSFAARREPRWMQGLLPRRSARAERAIVKVTRAKQEPTSPEKKCDTPAPVPEAAGDLYHRIKRALEQRVLGNPTVCRRLALIGAAHLLGVTHQRVLLAGPSGSGKTHASRSLAEVLTRPFMRVNATDLTPTGWRGGELNDFLEELAHRADGSLIGAVLVLDEIDKAACLDPAADGNSREAKLNLQSALLGLCDGSPVSPDSIGKKQLETAGLLVIGIGAFGGLFGESPPSTEDLVRWGWMPEFAARWGDRINFAPLGRREAFDLLRSSENSVERRLGPLILALGIHVKVTDALLAYVVDAWLSTGTDFRTASEWVLAAARRRIIEALESGRTELIVLAPDDVAVEVARRRR